MCPVLQGAESALVGTAVLSQLVADSQLTLCNASPGVFCWRRACAASSGGCTRLRPEAATLPNFCSCACSGGDLRTAIEHDDTGELRWYGRGHRIALDIARGLYYLHSHEVRAVPDGAQAHADAATAHAQLQQPLLGCALAWRPVLLHDV